MHRHKNRGEIIIPRGDRTGPRGAGPMTGRGAGCCAGYSVPGYANPVGGYGRGWGTGRMVYPAPVAVQPVYPPAQPQSPEQEIQALENYQKDLEAEKSDLDQEMGGVKARIEELKAKLEK